MQNTRSETLLLQEISLEGITTSCSPKIVVVQISTATYGFRILIRNFFIKCFI